MKIGFNLYRHMLDEENYRFARQCGATHLVVHLVDYFNGNDKTQRKAQAVGQPSDDGRGWGVAGNPRKIWSLKELRGIVQQANDNGLEVFAIENFDPAHWYDILLDGPRKNAQIKNLKTMIQRVGEAGIPVIGYNFSIAGVCGRVTGEFARGRALSVGMNGPFNKPIPKGMVWNMTYSDKAGKGSVPVCTSQQLWDRLRWFLDEVLPVAEASGVVLAAHPDDPPMPTMRGQPRLVFQPEHYDTLLEHNSSPSNQLEFCLGSIAEMPEGDIYQAVDHFSKLNRIAYIHFRNITGKVPCYREVFPDEGDIDFRRVFRILIKNRFDGVIVPDHTPAMNCAAPWHAGMAFTVGYIKGLMEL
jgi:mannonate dehydratase